MSNKNIDYKLLTDVMSRMGYTQVGNAFFDFANNKVEFIDGDIVTEFSYGAKFDMARFENTYCKCVIEEACNEYGWKLDETGDDEYEVQKGY